MDRTQQDKSLNQQKRIGLGREKDLGRRSQGDTTKESDDPKRRKKKARQSKEANGKGHQGDDGRHAYGNDSSVEDLSPILVDSSSSEKEDEPQGNCCLGSSDTDDSEGERKEKEPFTQ